jgi:hypothetical protein
LTAKQRFLSSPQLIALLLILTGTLIVPALAQQFGGGAPFNHNATGFILDGAHVRERCESCHLQGLFRGTPRDCASCHRPGGRATGKTPPHIPTSVACDSCHFSASWTPTTFRHRTTQGVAVGSCTTCHNGSTATGKPLNHVPTSNACDSCHKTTAWLPAGYTHALTVPGSCATCHDGTRATGKTARHIPTTASCDACHAIGTAFTPVSVGVSTLHANMRGPTAPGNCSTCHGGGFVAQNAQAKPATHFPTSDQCDSCHTSTTTWALAAFDHAALATSPTGICSSCHGTSALGKTSSHVPTAQPCDTCHTGFTAFRPAQMNHFGVTGQCSTCHNGAFDTSGARGKPATHIPTSAQCDACHVNGFATWSPAAMDHTGLAGKCITCHSGSFTSQNAQVKPATHVSTTAQCDACHQSTTTWATRIFNHELASPPVAGRCASCHNSVTALGKPATHIPTSGQCNACHQNFNAFKPARMDHAGTAARCSTCHNGAYVSANALARPVGHIPTTVQCDSCHVGGFVNWSPATMNHAGLAGLCSSCHGGAYVAQNAQVKPATHIATTAQCDSCHSSTTSWATATFNHQTANPPVAGRCSSCHNGATALGKPTNHIPTSAPCDSCHVNFTTFAPAAMNHAGAAGLCSNCHNGSFVFAGALAKNPTHVPTVAQCDSCHRSTASWSGALFAHPANAAGACSSCHNGTTAVGKAATHVPTVQQCDSCHTTFTAFTPAQMNHAGLAGQCATCHNGAFVAAGALGKPSVHVPTSAQCDACHVNGFVAFAPGVMNHAATSAPVAAGNCATCHSGAFVAQNAQIKPPTHIATAAQCDSCHSSTVSWATATFNHANASPPVTGRCTACHNGTNALGKPTTHVPTGAQCDTCHTGFVAFLPAAMNHAATTAPVAAGNCASCHSGSFVSMNARAKPATHIVTTASCDACHTTIAWLPTNFNHQGIVAGSCATCHNGTNARGKATTHLPTSAACDVCHVNFAAFAPATMSHAATNGPLAAGSCSTCHSGAFVAINAQVKPPTHIATTAQCDSCHLSTVSWATAIFTHPPTATGRCADCHNGTNALGKPTNHIPTTTQCDTCHKNFTAFAPATMSHAGTSGPAAAGNCTTCHGGAYVSVHALAKPASHIPTTKQCDSCHTGGFVGWSPSVMNHTGLAGQCSTCHSGAYATQNAQTKPPTHIATTAQCDTCHSSTTSWATATFNHATATPAVAGRCSSCHNGTSALGKPTNHIPTTAQCDTCHKVFTAFAPASMSHTGTTGPLAAGNCASCHNGAFTFANALGKPLTHVATTQSCDVCHPTVAWKPTSFAHTGVVPGTCATCHNGVQALGKPTLHIPTSLSCDSCHRTGVAWLPLNPFAHTGVAAGTCASCHVSTFPNISAKPANHLPTTAACDACHHSFTAWLPTTYNHAGIAAATCQVCHGGAYANIVVKPANHIPTTTPTGMPGNECSLCHSSTLSFATERMNHGTMQTSCRTCHLSSATYLGTMDKKATSHENMGTRDCSSSGCHRPLGSRGSPYTRWN